jgi:hypothetical protein
MSGEARSSLVSVKQSPDLGLVVAEREKERARFLGAELWSEAGAPDAEELRRLVVDGLEKGFLSYDEIAAALEDVGLTREQSEDFYSYLVERSSIWSRASSTSSHRTSSQRSLRTRRRRRRSST